jgi:hypothetical protein
MGVMAPHLSIEQWIAAVEDIKRRERLCETAPLSLERLTLEEAIKALRRLGYSSGDALRLLRGGKHEARHRP